MYQNTVEQPRLDLQGAIRTQDGLGDGIATLLLPPIAVEKQAANMPSLLTTNDQIIDIKRAPKTNYARVEATLGNMSYNCQESGIEVPLDATDYNTLGQDAAEQIATIQGANIVISAREAAVAAVLTGSAGETLLTGQVTEPDSGENWGESGGLPIDDVLEADEALSLRYGEGLRWLVISQYEYNDLQRNAQIRTNFRSIAGMRSDEPLKRKLKPEELAMLFGVDRLLIGNRRKNTANKGQTAVYEYIWPARYALLVRGVINPADLTEPALGRTFMWTEGDASITGGEQQKSFDAQQALKVQTYRDSDKAADIVRTSEWTDQKLLNLPGAQLIKLPADD